MTNVTLYVTHPKSYLWRHSRFNNKNTHISEQLRHYTNLYNISVNIKRVSGVKRNVTSFGRVAEIYQEQEENISVFCL